MVDALLKAIGVKTLTEYFDYLDRLRESGVTTMWGASPFLMQEFEHELTKHQASRVHLAWMRTFEEGYAAEHRAIIAIGED